ncbi:hypothetical protein CS542_08905 [Pedobacter sp. IW39]|nr:hypothetical protein CS542_08905 [Pedobacter sp. IW39]
MQMIRIFQRISFPPLAVLLLMPCYVYLGFYSSSIPFSERILYNCFTTGFHGVKARTSNRPLLKPW